MRAANNLSKESAALTEGSDYKRYQTWLDEFPARLANAVSPNRKTRPRPLISLVSIAGVLVLGVGVRWLYWQDVAPKLSTEDKLSQNMALQYRREARRILEEGTILFPRNYPDPSDARMLVHPPGYSLVMAAGFRLFGEEETPLRILQIACDGAAVVIVFLITAELFPFAVAVLAGLLLAVSPHASYYSLRLSPDSLAVLPIILSIFLVVKATQQQRWYHTAAAGALLGLSCWLRANALLLPFLLAVLMPLLFERGRWLKHSLSLLAVSLLVISPITMRNWIVFHHFIPVALPSGVNLVQGIAEIDKEGRFGMPLFDPDVLVKDVEWNNKPEYGGQMWAPDGIERDRVRFAKGLDVIRSHPIWFVSAMLQRASFMVSYNDSKKRDWPFNTATVSPVTATPPFGRSLSSNVAEPILSAASNDLLEGGKAMSDRAEISLLNEPEALQIAGGGPDFEDQYMLAPISVRKNSNYVLRVDGKTKQGLAAVKVRGKDWRVTLATAILPPEKASNNETIDSNNAGAGKQRPKKIEDDRVLMPFASGDADKVTLIVSDNGAGALRPIVEIKKVDLFEAGQTPTLWTHIPRVLIRGIEKNLFKTVALLPLIVVGILLLAIARRGRPLVILLTVPVYYLVTHAPFSTEYRYVLAIHCFLFIFAALTLYSSGLLFSKLIRRLSGVDSRSETPLMRTETI